MSPDLELEEIERAHLVAMVGTEGFRVLQKIMLTECEKFKVKLINADSANAAQVLAAHNLAKAAAQFYQAVANTINEEVLLYKGVPRVGDKPVDVTEGLLDFGAVEQSGGEI